jgi:hypothetical protein
LASRAALVSHPELSVQPNLVETSRRGLGVAPVPSSPERTPGRDEEREEDRRKAFRCRRGF